MAKKYTQKSLFGDGFWEDAANLIETKIDSIEGEIDEYNQSSTSDDRRMVSKRRIQSTLGKNIRDAEQQDNALSNEHGRDNEDRRVLYGTDASAERLSNAAKEILPTQIVGEMAQSLENSGIERYGEADSSAGTQLGGGNSGGFGAQNLFATPGSGTNGSGQYSERNSIDIGSSLSHRTKNDSDVLDGRLPGGAANEILDNTFKEQLFPGEQGEQRDQSGVRISDEIRKNGVSLETTIREGLRDIQEKQNQSPGETNGGLDELRGNSGEDTRGYYELRRSQVLGNKIVSLGQNNDFTAKSEILIAGAKDKFKKNYEALKLVKELIQIKKKAKAEEKNFTITEEEQKTISQFSGWGDGRLANGLFNSKNEEWQKEREDISNLLTHYEYTLAAESSLSAYYTPRFVIDAMYKALENFGLYEDGRKKEILEPSAGNGAFLMFGDKQKNNYTTVEVDNLSFNALELLYPSQDHYNIKFEKFIPIQKFDAVIGNPPYGNIRAYSDPYNSDLTGASIHNFFAAKSIRLLKKDGITAFVISSKFMDAKDASIREIISKEATFLGALRLPDSTFKNAGTKVTADIVFFQEGRHPEIEKNWLLSEETAFQNIDKKFSVNQYFKNNPQNILGKLTPVVGQGGILDIACLEDPSLNLEQKIDEFIATLPKHIYKWHEPTINQDFLVLSESDSEYRSNKRYFDGLREDNLLIYRDQIFIKRHAQKSETLYIEKVKAPKTDLTRVKLFIQMRDTHKLLTRLEKQDIADDDPRLIAVRAKLNEAYDSFHKKKGEFLNNPGINKTLKKDVEFSKISSLEKGYQRAVSIEIALRDGIPPKDHSAQKADILLGRINRPNKIMSFNNVEDGLLASMNIYGKPNIGYIASFLKKDEGEVAKELLDQNKIFIDPEELEKSGKLEYIFASKYLSGDVREKFKVAERVSKIYPGMAHNLSNLKAVIPPDLKASEIEAPMGSSWIPLRYYNDFFEKELGIPSSSWKLNRSDISGAWTFQGSSVGMSRFNLSQMSFDKFSPYVICRHALENSTITIKKETNEPVLNPDGTERVDKNGYTIYKKIVDKEKTQQINSMIERIRDDFSDWLWKDYDRRADLVQIYNDTFNCYAKKRYDGSKLELENFSSIYTLRKHQKDAIFRAINENNCLFDHEVGAGKTLTAICSIMKQKQLGILNKPIFAVPNHLVTQWSDEFMSAYPDANILVADANSMDKEHRNEFYGKIINENWDAIIMAHSQIERIPVPAEIERKVIQREIDELEETISFLEEESENGRSYSVKEVQKRVQSLRAKLESAIDKKSKTKMIDFSDLGVDCLIVDESHLYKNLPFSTHLKVKGLGNKIGSKKALAMLGFTTYLNENNKKILFLTGTPVSNSLTELYGINKYLMPKELEQKGIGSFDAWAANFTKIEKTPELNASARNYKIVDRLAALNNLPEVCGAYNNVADIVTNSDIKQYYKYYVPGVNIKKSIALPSRAIREYIGVEDANGFYDERSIIGRMDKLSKGGFDPRIDNYLKCTSDAKKAGIDFRLIDRNAKDYKGSKINKCVENTFEEYQKWGDDRGTQLIFLDIGTPKRSSKSIDIEAEKEIEETDKDDILYNNDYEADEPGSFTNFNDEIESNRDEEEYDGTEEDRDAGENSFELYVDIYKKLVKKGVPRQEIAFIHDADTPEKKRELYRKVNSGEVRILLGSTNKMGAGTNVQERVVAIHHIDAPWRPADFIQRDGRVIRQGNMLFERDPENFKINEYRYITERTYDAVAWQIIETKSKALLNFRKGTVNSRSLSGFEEEAASAAEMKAAATGNPLFMDQVRLKAALDKEEAVYKKYLNDYQDAEDTIRANWNKIQNFKKEKYNIEQAKTHLLEYEERFNPAAAFKCSIIKDGKAVEFNIPAKTDSENIRLEQDKMKGLFERAINLTIRNHDQTIPILNYKGFRLDGYYSSSYKELSFTINMQTTDNNEIEMEPENLIYKLGDGQPISFAGFIKRTNNFLNEERLNLLIKGCDDNIAKFQQNTQDLTAFIKQNPTYERQELLNLLKKENKVIMNELNKIASNKGYKSNFKSQALEMLESLSRNRSDKDENCITM